MVLIHISNQHLDLTRVFRGWTAAGNQRVAILGYRPDARAAAEGAAPTLAMALAPRQSTLQAMVRGRWRWLGDGRSVEWTDNRADLVAVIGKIRF